MFRIRRAALHPRNGVSWLKEITWDRSTRCEAVGAVADVADAVGTVTADAAGVAVEEGARGAMYRIYRYQMSPTSRAATIRKQAPGVVAEDQGAVDAVARPWAVIATRSKSDLQPCR
jgi:hypothetical protein